MRWRVARADARRAVKLSGSPAVALAAELAEVCAYDARGLLRKARRSAGARSAAIRAEAERQTEAAERHAAEALRLASQQSV